MKTCFDICTSFLLHFSESKKIQRHTNLHRSSHTALFIFALFQPNVNFLTTDFGTNPHIKFHENLSVGSGVVPRGQTDGQADSRFS
jgi:hypothetical protein